jgi:phage gp16-like protein
MANHVAAIHVLKTRLGLDESAYRDLLAGLTGKRSCSAMGEAELLVVRGHLERLISKHGLAVDAPTRRRRMTQEQFEAARQAASPRERKVWALWHQLARDGLVRDASARALDHYVARQVQVSALRFCSSAQLHTVIESLKRWASRGATVGADDGRV